MSLSLSNFKLSSGKSASVRKAIASARSVLLIFEAKFPHDKRPRKAIEAAQRWLNNPTEANRKAARSAAFAVRGSMVSMVTRFS